MAAGFIIAVNRPASSSTSKAGIPTDPRASVLEIEWRTPTGYERCAAVVTAHRPHGLEALTAEHCALRPFSVVRFFNGRTLYGSSVSVTRVFDTADAALLYVAADAALVQSAPASVPARTVPPMGTTLTIVGHPVSALAGPDAGRWTVFYGRMGEITQSDLGALQDEVYCVRCGPGNSGSGVFDGEGRLVGIVYGVTEITGAAGGRLPDGPYADVIPLAALR